MTVLLFFLINSRRSHHCFMLWFLFSSFGNWRKSPGLPNWMNLLLELSQLRDVIQSWVSILVCNILRSANLVPDGSLIISHPSLSLSLSPSSLSLSRTHTNTHTHRLNMFLSSVTLVRVCSDRDKCTHSHSSQPAPTGWTLLLVKLEDHVCGYSSIHSSICPHSPPLQGWVLTLSELQHLAPPSPCLRLRHDFTPFFSWVGLFQIPHISDPT